MRKYSSKEVPSKSEFLWMNAGDIVKSIGITLAYRSKEVAETDEMYGEDYQMELAMELALHARMLYELLETWPDTLKDCMVRVPEGIGVKRVRNPLFVPPKSEESPDGDSTAGWDELDPF